MAKKHLVKFLVQLYGDPQAEKKFHKNRKKYLAGTKLTTEERDLLVRGDVEGLRSYLGATADALNIVDSSLSEIVDTALSEIVDTALSEIVDTALSEIVDSALARRPTTKKKPTKRATKKPAQKATKKAGPKGRKRPTPKKKK